MTCCKFTAMGVMFGPMHLDTDLSTHVFRSRMPAHRAQALAAVTAILMLASSGCRTAPIWP